MKKLVLVTLMAGLIPMIAAAQGTVSFQSSGASQIVVQPDGTTPVGAGFSAGLYWGVQGSGEGALILLGPTVAPMAGTGFIVGGTRTTGAGTAPGATATFQVKAWDGGHATYEDAWTAGTGLAGKTALFDNPTGNPNSTPPGTPAFLSGWTSVLVVNPIPEPSIIALAGLGVASLLIFRRRR